MTLPNLNFDARIAALEQSYPALKTDADKTPAILTRLAAIETETAKIAGALSRLTAIETSLAAINTRLGQLVAPDTITGMGQRVAALEQRATATETMLGTKIPDFEKVGVRVNELSAAYLAANERLSGVEASIVDMEQEQPAPAEQRILAVEAAVSTMANRVSTLENARSRVGLSARLSGIEASLSQLLGQAGGNAK